MTNSGVQDSRWCNPNPAPARRTPQNSPVTRAFAEDYTPLIFFLSATPRVKALAQTLRPHVLEMLDRSLTFSQKTLDATL